MSQYLIICPCFALLNKFFQKFFYFILSVNYTFLSNKINNSLIYLYSNIINNIIIVVKVGFIDPGLIKVHIDLISNLIFIFRILSRLNEFKILKFLMILKAIK